MQVTTISDISLCDRRRITQQPQPTHGAVEDVPRGRVPAVPVRDKGRGERQRRSSEQQGAHGKVLTRQFYIRRRWPRRNHTTRYRPFSAPMHATTTALAVAAGSLALYALYRRRRGAQSDRDGASEPTEHEIEVRRFDEHVASDPRVLPCRLSKPLVLGICGYDPASEKVSYSPYHQEKPPK